MPAEPVVRTDPLAELLRQAVEQAEDPLVRDWLRALLDAGEAADSGDRLALVEAERSQDLPH